MKKKRRFDLRRSQVDGMFRRWELVPATQLGMQDPEAVLCGVEREWFKWTVTAVFRTRKEAFAGAGGK